jgi:hypothetical protein
MGYPLDCRRCGGYEDHKADCPQLREWADEALRKHRETMERIARESAPPSQLERIATALFAAMHTPRADGVIPGCSPAEAVRLAKGLAAALDREDPE